MTSIIRDIDIAVEEIKKGNVIALPTETVYGLAANALDADAVLKIYEIKERPQFNPLIVHIGSIDEMSKYTVDIPNEIYKLMEKFSPGPITYVLKKKDVIPDIVCAGLSTVAIRIPSHKIFNEVLEKTGLPISAPSANRFGRVSPTQAEDVMKELEGRIDYILDGGKCEIGIESTVLGYGDGGIEILRPGFITKEVIGGIAEVSSKSGRVNSQGMIKYHYAPETPLYITNDEFLSKYEKTDNIGIMNLKKYKSLKDLAVNLFSEMRAMDEKGYDYIVTSKVSNEGIGRAINDRIYKAASGFLINVNDNMKLIEK